MAPQDPTNVKHSQAGPPEQLLGSSLSSSMSSSSSLRRRSEKEFDVRKAFVDLHQHDPSLFREEPFQSLFHAILAVGDPSSEGSASTTNAGTAAHAVVEDRLPLCLHFVLTSMRTALHNVNVPVLQRGMKILVALLASRSPTIVPTLLRKVTDANGSTKVSVAVLTDVLEMLKDEAYLIRLATQAAAGVTAISSQKLHRKIVQTGLVDGLRAAASNHRVTDNVTSALSILQTLSNLSISVSYSKSILSALEGCLPLIVQLMHDYDLYVGMQEYGCCILHNMAPFCPKAILYAGGLNAVIRALKLHGHHGKVQGHGNVVLLRLVPTNKINSTRSASSPSDDDAGGDEVRSVKNFPLCLALILNALRATANDDTNDDADFLLLRGMKILLDMTSYSTFASDRAILSILLKSAGTNHHHHHHQHRVDVDREMDGEYGRGDAMATSFLLDVLTDFPYNFDLVVHTLRVIANIGAISSLDLRRRWVQDGLTDALASTVDAHVGSIPVASNVMQTLSHLSFEVAYSDTVVTALEESIPLIVALMRRHASVEDISQHGCCILNNLSMVSPEAIADAGGTSAVVYALKVSGDNDAIQDLGSTVLLRLIPVLCKGMEDDSTHEAIQEKTMAMIALVAAQVGPKIKESLVRSDGKVAASIVKIFGAHPRNEAIISDGLKALAILSDDASAELREAMTTCVERILIALHHHADNVEIQDCGYRVLRNLSSSRGWNVSADATGAVLATMRMHRMQVEIVEQGCVALTKLLRSDMGSQSIVVRAVAADNFISTLFEIAETYSADTNIQQHVFEFLYLLSCNKFLTTHSTKRFVTDQNISEILERMKQPQFLDSAEFCTFVCGLLMNLSVKPSNQEAIASMGGIEVILSTMRRYTTVAEIQTYGCSILRNLALNDRNQDEILACEGISIIMLAMIIYPDEASIQAHGCDALAHLATGNRAAQRIIVEDENGVAVVTDTLKRHPDHAGVQKLGKFLLECISDYNQKDEDANGILAEGRASFLLKDLMKNLST